MYSQFFYACVAVPCGPPDIVDSNSHKPQQKWLMDSDDGSGSLAMADLALFCVYSGMHTEQFIVDNRAAEAPVTQSRLCQL